MKVLTGQKYKEMLLYSAVVLEKKKEEINDLNVFPVPDGDTGSNMNMTFQAGCENITHLETNSIQEVANVFSKGMLMGARGNSGVILSQFFRGFAEGVAGYDEINTVQFHQAIFKAQERAYSSVIKAVEGTILTVAREMYENISDVSVDYQEYFSLLVEVAEVSLNNTPELLDVLKEVGVVDSGGAGLVAIFEGMLYNLKGEKMVIEQNFENIVKMEKPPLKMEDITFGFCTEMLVKLNDLEITQLQVYEKVEEFGDSIVTIIDDDILKVHVHTEEPLKVFEYGMSLGTIINLKSENMRIQFENAHLQKENRKAIGLVSVASSEVMANLFKDIQDVEIVQGGQTLNPSIDDIVKAIAKANAEKVIVLPNNSNIIMAAETAKGLADVEVEVIKTKHMTEAIECLIHFDENESLEKNVEEMSNVLLEMKNIEITHAIRDTEIQGVKVDKNDFLCIINGNIKSSEKTIDKVLDNIMEKIIENENELITVLVGENGSLERAEQFKKDIEDKVSFAEVDIYYTEQPVYHYLLSII